eukprot:g27909.t1
MHILQHFRNLQSDPTTKKIFPSPPLSTFRRDRSLHDSLVSSKLPTNPSTTLDTFPCNCRRYYTCPRHLPCHLHPRPQTILPDLAKIHLQFIHLIYYIRWSWCCFLYIRETKRRFGDQFMEHLCSARNNQPNLPVAIH